MVLVPCLLYALPTRTQHDQVPVVWLHLKEGRRTISDVDLRRLGYFLEHGGVPNAVPATAVGFVPAWRRDLQEVDLIVILLFL